MEFSSDSKKSRKLLAQPQRAELRFVRGWGDIVGEEVSAILRDLSTPAKFEPQLSVDPTSVFLTDLDVRVIGEIALRVRTAHDLIWWIGSAPVPHKGALARALKEVPWSAYFEEGTPVTIRAASRKSTIYHTGLVTEACAEVFAESGLVAAERDDAEQLIELRLINDRLDIGLSCGFPSLAHRGYKQLLSHVAPLREDLAACMIRWLVAGRGEGEAQSGTISHCYVPFAGSGTLAVEAMLELGAIAPCAFERMISFQRLACAPTPSLLHVRKRLGARIGESDPLHLICVESDLEIAESLRANLEFATAQISAAAIPEGGADGEEQPASGLDVSSSGISSPDSGVSSTLQSPFTTETACEDFFHYSLKLPDSAHVCVLLNPPFGGRLATDSDAATFYGEIGAALRSQLGERASCGALLAPSPDAATAFFEQGFTNYLNPPIVDRRPITHGGKPLIAARWYDLDRES